MKSNRSDVFLSILFVFCFAANVDAQKTLDYRIGWDAPNSHTYNITLTLDAPAGKTVDVRIPDWRPGRYMVQHFAKNIMRFSATDGMGKPLTWQKIDKVTWRIKTQGAKKVITKYAYYARQLDAGASYLDDAEAYFNPITCFMYIPGKENLPVSLVIDKPASWKIATAMPYNEKKKRFEIGNYHDFVDSPFLISPSFKKLSFEYKGAVFELVFQGQTNYDEKKVIEDVKKIVVEQIDMMEDVPFKRYLFMYHLVPYRFGHGVEHKNSTSIVTGPADFDNKSFYRGFLSVTAHEFFHVWNVERIRPEGIGAPDYARPNFTTLLWVSEGMTSYYGGLSMLHAGLTKKKSYLSGWAKTIKSYRDRPGYRFRDVSEVSREVWSNSWGAPPNTSYSFYSMGNMLGLLLDLEIRHRTKNKKSLDDVFRYLNKNYPQKGRFVPDVDFLKVINKVSGKDFKSFFAKYVDGTEEFDWERYLGYAGLELKAEKDKKKPDVTFGFTVRGDKKESKITNVLPDTPAFRAGLDVNDILVALDGWRLHAANLDQRLKQYQPGDTVDVTVIRREQLRTFKVELAAAKKENLSIVEIEEPTELQAEILKSWLKLPEKTEEEKTEEDGKEKKQNP